MAEVNEETINQAAQEIDKKEQETNDSELEKRVQEEVEKRLAEKEEAQKKETEEQEKVKAEQEEKQKLQQQLEEMSQKQKEYEKRLEDISLRRSIPKDPDEQKDQKPKELTKEDKIRENKKWVESKIGMPL